jgi:hypothetical protein
MKKILTKTQREKGVKRNRLIIGMVLIGLMVLSTVGYALTGRGESSARTQNIKIRGVDFVKNDAYWQFSLNGQDYVTEYNPSEIKDIKTVEGLSLQNFQNKPLYFVGDNEAISELARNLNNQALRVQKACLSEDDCKENSPIKNCSENNIIIVKEPDKNESQNIYKTDNCIFIIANSTEQAKYSDAFLFSVLNI